jgi:phosphodiesterase/alkaline phosphatase D-like protein
MRATASFLLLALALPAAAQTAAPAPGTPEWLASRTTAAATHVTHGPMLGRPGATSVGVWARTDRPGGFRVYYGLQPDRLDQVSPPAATALERDNTGWILLEGLQPDTRYHYAVGVSDTFFNPERRGTFRTLPSADVVRHARDNPRGLFNFAFAANACNRTLPRNSSGLTPYATMLREAGDEVQFALHAGDWIYEEGRLTSAEAWAKTNRVAAAEMPERLRLAPTLAGGWENYKLYLDRNPHLAAWHARVPTLYTYDDHEVINNVYGAGVAGFSSRIAVWRDIGLGAWHDYLAWANPLPADAPRIHLGRARLRAGSDILTDESADFTRLPAVAGRSLHVHWGRPTAGEGGNIGEFYREGPADPNSLVYEVAEVLDAHRLRLRPAAKADSTSSYSLGGRHYFNFSVANCEFFVVDTRGERGLGPKDSATGRAESMLGARQFAWLKGALAQSTADFVFLLSSVPWSIPHFGSDPERGGETDESWTGYLAEREELMALFAKLARPVIIVTGDLHNAFSIQVSDNVWEVVASPMGSDNQHTLAAEGDRPPNGRFDSAGRPVEIRWSTFFQPETRRENRRQPVYAVFQLNNVFNNPDTGRQDRWIAYPRPQLVVRWHDAFTGRLLYAESILAPERR